MSIRVDARKVQEALRELAPAIDAKIAELLPGEGAALLAKAQQNVPVRSGRLRDSGFTSSEETADGVRVVVGYTADYAPMVHEITAPAPHHKWFENAFNEFEGEFQERLVKIVQEALTDSANA